MKREKKFTYFFVAIVIKIALRVVLGYRIKADEAVKKLKRGKDPFVVLSAHPSELDAAPLLAALYPRYGRIVAGAQQVCKGAQGRLFRMMNVIPKKQFVPDLNAVREMLQTVKDGHVLAFMPEGRVSMDGLPSPIDPSCAKLVKKLRVPVVGFIAHGTYFVKPPYDYNGIHCGRIGSELKLIATAEEAAALSIPELEAKIDAALAYDASEELRNGLADRRGYGPRRAPYMKQISRLLYACPVCGAEYSIADADSRVFCTACGAGAKLSRRMLFEPDTEPALPADLSAWSRFQKELEERRVKDPDFRLVYPVRKAMKLLTEDTPFAPRCEGTLTLDREKLRYEDAEESLEVPVKSLPGLSADYMDGSVILYRDEVMRRFYLPDPRDVSRIMNALMALRKNEETK